MDNNGTNLRLQRHEHEVETLDQLKKKSPTDFGKRSAKLPDTLLL